MALGRRPSQAEHDHGTGTLGALLYADKTRTPASESEWVELIQAIGAGNQRALHVLYERMHRIVFTLSMRITSSPDLAEEVTVDVFHDVWRRASTYDAKGGPVVGWIMNQARSRAIDRLRHERRKKRDKRQAEGQLPVPPAREPHEDLRMKERSRVLGEALRILTEAERYVIETAFFSELTHAEVAARLNEPLGTIKTRIRSGLQKLRSRLLGEGGEP